MKMKYFFKSSGYFLILILVSIGCSTSQNATSTTQSETIVGKVAQDNVTLNELKQNYQSTNNKSAPSTKELTDFLPVYLNYKAKLLEARSAGYYQDTSIINEYNNYAQQAAYSFWIENKISDSLLEELYQRSQQELKASHILVRLTSKATPKEVANAYDRLMVARHKYLQGKASFDSLAEKYSTHMSGRSLGGNLGYITGGQTIKPFEDALYSLKVDSVSMPVRTKYGYHLILLKDRRPRKADRQVSHIFFSTKGRDNTIDSAMERAKVAYTALKEGKDWDLVAQKYSEDRQSRDNGGLIGWINYGRYKETMVDTIMAIDSVGHYTHPFYSGYGVQIIKLDSIRNYGSAAREKEALMSKLKRLPRFKNQKKLVLQQAAEVGKAKKYNENVNQFIFYITSQKPNLLHDASIPSKFNDQPLYEIAGDEYTAGQYFTWLQKNHGNLPTTDYRLQWFNDYTNQAISDHLVKLTKKKFDNFEDKIKNYMDGLVVFQISEDSVWNAASKDTAKLQAMYQSHPDKYRYKKRYLYYLVSSSQDSLLNMSKNKIQKGINPDSIDIHMNKLFIQTDSTSYVDDFPFDKLPHMRKGSFSNIFKYKKQKSYLYLKDILKARRMSFSEAYNKLVSDYQPIREKEWKNNLEHKYSIKSYPDRIRKADNNKLTAN